MRDPKGSIPKKLGKLGERIIFRVIPPTIPKSRFSHRSLKPFKVSIPPNFDQISALPSLELSFVAPWLLENGKPPPVKQAEKKRNIHENIYGN